MKENDRVAGIRFEDESKCVNKVAHYAIWHKTNGVKWYDCVVFKTKEEAVDQIMRMPKYYEEEGDSANAKSWEEGEHVVVPVEIPVPNMEE